MEGLYKFGLASEGSNYRRGASVIKIDTGRGMGEAWFSAEVGRNWHHHCRPNSLINKGKGF